MAYKNVREQAVVAIAALEKSIALYRKELEGSDDADLLERFEKIIADKERQIGIHQARIDSYDEELRLGYTKPATSRAGKHKPYGGETTKK